MLDVGKLAKDLLTQLIEGCHPRLPLFLGNVVMENPQEATEYSKLSASSRQWNTNKMVIWVLSFITAIAAITTLLQGAIHVLPSSCYTSVMLKRMFVVTR